MSTTPAIEAVERGRDAYARHAWTETVDTLAAVDREQQLGPEDLERLGTAAWWTGRLEESIDALERAFGVFSEAGRPADAARVGLQLAYQAFRRLNPSVGGGWLGRVGQLLEGQPESSAHAMIGVFRTLEAAMGSRMGEAIERADEVMEIARRVGDRGAENMAMSFKGLALMHTGRIEEGLALIDQSAAAAAAGELDLRIASDIWCNTIAACRNVGDLARAAQWAQEGERWMRRNGVGGYPGICKVHRAELKRLGGRWQEAEQEARVACEELERFRLLDAVGFAYTEIGEIRLRMGDLEGAADAFDRAYEHGSDGQPGLAMLQLARGEIDDARRSIDRAIAQTAGTDGFSDRAWRARLLPAKVEVELAAGDLEAARAAVEDLEAIAMEFAKPLFEAGAMTARGELLLGEDRPAEASPVLGRSWRLWHTSDLPYESARARLHYAEALAAEGDASTAKRDLLAARAVFERLGATRDVARADALLGPDGAPAPAAAASHGERVRRTFMFTDIVVSTDLVGLIGDEAWKSLLEWHDRSIRAGVVQHGGLISNHTGDGFFVAFDRAADAIDCAVDIQRSLVRHRREHGFAPWVRIGLHTTDAMRTGKDFAGHGVHVAARVGAAATRDEILVTGDVLREAGAVRFPLGEPRSMSLKGVQGPVEVRSVGWA